MSGLDLGSHYLGSERCSFTVWAPDAAEVQLHLKSPRERLVPMARDERGYYHVELDGVAPGARYLYRLAPGKERPDPVSRSQPDGVHGPSEVVSRDFAWTDARWQGLPLEKFVLYELHVGTFTAEGTFDAAAGKLDYLKELGVTSVELMPVAEFPGERNWGYDGVYPYAVQRSYGGREGLKRFVDRCHSKGIAVTLDVVYNHLGPEGNYLSEYGPYFTERYRSPWGAALNFDGTHSDEVRRFFLQNALQWVDEFHIDSLRLDASDTINDQSAYPFLRELADTVRERAAKLGRKIWLVAESDRNDPRFALPSEKGGYGLDGIWNDGLHHALHRQLTGEKAGYYEDFGELSHLAKAIREGFVYSGQYSTYRKRRHGQPSTELKGHQLVVCSQNHDQVGNRMLGERLSQLVDFEALKLAAATYLLAPAIPLIFMGEEYAEKAPFLYFVSHGDPGLIEAVRKGRREEFSAFRWSGEPPDPQSVETFQRSRLDQSLRQNGKHRVMLELYVKLLAMRREVEDLADLDRNRCQVEASERDELLVVRRGDLVSVSRFAAQPAKVSLDLPAGTWHKLLDTADEAWKGQGSRLPAQLGSEGKVDLELAGWQYALYEIRVHLPKSKFVRISI